MILFFMPLAVSAEEFMIKSFMLKNGMQVVVLPNHRSPVIFHSVWYKVGSKDDPLFKSGLAHFLEHMMFKSTTNSPSGSFTKTVEQLGGKYNATTGYDRTNYYEIVDIQHLEEMMKLEADRMVNLTIDPKEVLSERDVVIEERLMSTDNPPQQRLFEMMMAHYYLHHPYRLPIIGWKHEMETYSREDALSFYKKWYAPNNAILLLSGDITEEKAKELAEKYYGSISAQVAETKQYPKEPSNHNISAKVILKDKDIGTPVLYLMYQGISCVEDFKKGMIFDILASLLKGSTGIWYETLVEKEKIITTLSAGAEESFSYSTPFIISVNLPKGGDVEKVEKRLRELIDSLIKDGVKPEDFEHAKIKSLNALDYIKDNPVSLGNFLGEILIKGITIDQMQSLRKVIQSITKDEFMAQLKGTFSKEPRVIAVGLPKD